MNSTEETVFCLVALMTVAADAMACTGPKGKNKVSVRPVEKNVTDQSVVTLEVNWS